MATATQLPTANSERARNFRDTNGFHAEGRVYNVEILDGNNGEYVAVSVITNLADGEDGVVVRFNDSASVLKLAKGGHLMNGRRVSVNGRIVGFANAYAKDGQIVGLKRPRLNLSQVRLDLGAKPKSAMADA